MKNQLIRMAITTVVALLIGLDKDKSAVAKWKPYLEPLRDDLLEIYPVTTES